MKASVFSLLLSSLALAGSLALAKPDVKGAASFRALASVNGIVFRLDAPDEQRVQGQDARFFYEALNKAKGLDEIDQKNLEEFRRLGRSLEARGYLPLQEPLTGQVFTPAQTLVLRRQSDQHVSASEGELAYTSVMFEYTYQQVYVKKGEAPKPASVLPRLKLHGLLFLHCKPDSKENCEISAIAVNSAEVRWDNLPSTRMGGNSSAGGAGQN